MTDEEVLAEFRSADALLEGHFILSSGLRSSRYLQCARVLADPKRGARLAEALVNRLPADLAIDIVVSPAMGGVIAGDAQQKILCLDGVEEANVEVVWDPPWHQSMITADGRKVLGLE